MPFLDYAGTRFVPFIVPIIPHGANLSPGSKLTPEKLGKIPGIKNKEGLWHSWPWQKHEGKEGHLAAFAKMYQADGFVETFGFQARRLPGVDIDINDGPIAEAVYQLSRKKLGEAPARMRPNSARMLLCYRFNGGEQLLRKRRRAYVSASGEEGAVEFLGEGQQYLIEGMHPSGVLYTWSMGQGPLQVGYDNLVLITVEQVEAFFAALDGVLAEYGWEPVKGGGSMRMSGSSRTTHEIGHDHPELAPDLDMLKDLLTNYLPCDHPEFAAYEEWANACLAIATACGKDEAFYDEVFLPWNRAGPDNSDEDIRLKWESARQTSIGWSYLTNIAHDYGYTADVEALFGNLDEDGVPSSGAPEAPQARAGSRGPVPKLMPPDFALHKLPIRPYVLGHRFMAGVVTLGVGAPGAGKSNLAILTALSIATGRPLTGEEVRRSGRVWVHNNEDSLHELYRRIGGMLQCHQIDFASVRENIFVSSGLDARLVVAFKEKDIVRRTEAVAEIIASVKEQGIVHIVIDPLISTHRGVSENSNDEIEQVIETIQHIAHETGCSIDLVHHALKSHSHNTEVHAGDMNAARGASALIGAARMVYTLSPMSKDTADKMKLHPAQAARMVRLDIGKGNYAARDTHARWFELEPFDIGNGNTGETFCEGDSIAVPKPWDQPTTHEQPASKADERDAQREAKLQRVRDIVAAAMPSERCEISKLRASVEHAFGIRKSAANDLIKAAIPEGADVTAGESCRSYVLTMERQLPSPPGRLYVVRKVSGLYSEAA